MSTNRNFNSFAMLYCVSGQLVPASVKYWSAEVLDAGDAVLLPAMQELTGGAGKLGFLDLKIFESPDASWTSLLFEV
jgi:hypothetical protein